jgi:hypothetical protein
MKAILEAAKVPGLLTTGLFALWKLPEWCERWIDVADRLRDRIR